MVSFTWMRMRIGIRIGWPHMVRFTWTSMRIRIGWPYFLLGNEMR